MLDFLQQHHTLTLATASPGGVPRASTFLYVNDGPTLYFWTRATTLTARQIEQNPVVAFTIDDYTEDLNQTRGVQGIGECSVILSGEEIARVADLFGQTFPVARARLDDEHLVLPHHAHRTAVHRQHERLGAAPRRARSEPNSTASAPTA